MITARIPTSRPEQAREAEPVQIEVSVPRGSLASQPSTQDTSTKTNEDVRRAITYPAWPTSRPGPQATSPLPGQHPHPLRTDQMVYECYVQERGRPGVLPLKSAVREQRGKISLPNASFQDIVFEGEAQQRWLDDGGSLVDKDTTLEIVGDSRLQRD
ncbi:MAG TPA: hypothetical protein VHZ51_05345 [Ktedonobacteraceae bacterium]|nr:hypothetical protein [Ktedonobacteraceae bacterium]